MLQNSGIKEEEKQEQIYMDKNDDEAINKIIRNDESRSNRSSPHNNNNDDMFVNMKKPVAPSFLNLTTNRARSRNDTNYSNWLSGAGGNFGTTGFNTLETVKQFQNSPVSNRPKPGKKFDEED